MRFCKFDREKKKRKTERDILLEMKPEFTRWNQMQTSRSHHSAGPQSQSPWSAYAQVSHDIQSKISTHGATFPLNRKQDTKWNKDLFLLFFNTRKRKWLVCMHNQAVISTPRWPSWTDKSFLSKKSAEESSADFKNKHSAVLIYS